MRVKVLNSDKLLSQDVRKLREIIIEGQCLYDLLEHLLVDQ